MMNGVVIVSILPICPTADSDSLRDAIPVETRTAPVQSVVMMECRTDLRQPVKYTWSRQGGILPKSARVEGVSNSILLKYLLYIDR